MKSRRYLLAKIYFFVHFLTCHQAISMPIDELVALAISNNQEIKIAEEKLQNSKLFNYLALNQFLPNIFVNYRHGSRVGKNLQAEEGQISNIDNKFSSTELLIEQNIFNGFFSLNDIKKSDKKYLLEMANLAERKQFIAGEVSTICYSIIYLKEILKCFKNIENLHQKISDIITIKIAKKQSSQLNFLNANEDASNQIQQRNLYELELAKNLVKIQQIVNIILPQNYFDFSVQDFANLELNLSNYLDGINHNFALKSKFINYQIIQDELSQRKADFAPKINISASYERQRNTIFFQGQKFNNRSVGINVNIPIFQRGDEYVNLKDVQQKKQIAIDEYELYKNFLISEIKSKYYELDASLKNHHLCLDILKNLQNKIEIYSIKNNLRVADLNQLYQSQIAYEKQKISCYGFLKDVANFHFKIQSLIGGMNV